MFLLSEVEHSLRLPPHLLSRPLNEAIKGELDSLFSDKVIQNLGLCVSMYDIRSIDGGFISPGDGASTYTVRFRLVMFQPFIGEVISARLKESNKDGLRLTLGFFDDIYVPVPLLPSPNHSEPDPEQKDGIRWIWEYEGENYPIDGTDEIRFRVHKISYPPMPLDLAKEESDQEESDKKESDKKESEQKNSKLFAPMVVTTLNEVHRHSSDHLAKRSYEPVMSAPRLKAQWDLTASPKDMPKHSSFHVPWT